MHKRFEKPERKRYFQIVRKENFKEKSKIIEWIKRFGVAGFLFFLIKGLLWLIISTVITYFAW